MFCGMCTTVFLYMCHKNYILFADSLRYLFAIFHLYLAFCHYLLEFADSVQHNAGV